MHMPAGPQFYRLAVVVRLLSTSADGSEEEEIHYVHTASKGL